MASSDVEAYGRCTRARALRHIHQQIGPLVYVAVTRRNEETVGGRLYTIVANYSVRLLRVHITLINILVTILTDFSILSLQLD